ncbi:MAG: winged helix-turn-helix domain-containing protein, partial [Streptosporangiaceae bacterium]|nr:winged helix-turn-helix domain-containing protein [Streptosporangiaceae bacterium]
MPALRILGPLRLRGVTGDAALGGDKPRRLLAALALHANEAVSAGRLTEVVWGATPPRSARQNLQTYVWSLRRALKAAGDRGPLIEAVPPGYALRVEPEDLDWLRFVRLTAAAGECLARDPATASKLLREALGYWRGPVLADVADDLGALRPRIAAMEEARLSALEQRIQADLATGRHHELTGELAELAAAYPLRERLRAHQMLALYRCGRQAEALAAYHQLRAQLAEELGVDPGPEPQRLFEAMLRADPGLDVPAQPAAADAADGRWPRVPRQLPAQAAGFAGRAGELRRMDEFLAAAPAALLIVAVTGPPGAGKTALALHWAHRVQQRFGDGTLFADLHGWDPGRPAAEPAEVLDGFLRALAIRPEDIPPGVDERAALLRSVLDGKRVLIVLDNVPEPGQVRPLLPGSAGCLVLITSRSRLSGLAARDGAARIALGPLAEDEALALLRQVTDPCRVEAEPAAASEVTRLCGGLPLALRIAADRIAAQPALALSGLVDQLSDERARLRLLATDDDDTAVRAAFSSSYRGLGVPAARMFRLAGLHAGREFSVAAAAAAAGTDETDARDLLVLLAGAHLLDDTVPGRFRLHDLLAVYAAERAAAEDPPGPRDRALRRLLGWYLHTADAADRTLIPRRARPPLARPPDDCRPVTFGGYDEAFAWCETERENLVCATRQAVAAGELEIAWQLPAALGAYLKISRRWDDWIATHEAGLGAARRLGDAAAEAWLLSSLGGAHGDLRQFGRAAECFARALAIRRELGDRHGQAVTLLNMGFLHWK